MDRYAELYEPGRHEIGLSDGRRVLYGYDQAYGMFVQLYDPNAGYDELGVAKEILVDVCERINGATAVKAAFDEWVLT